MCLLLLSSLLRVIERFVYIYIYMQLSEELRSSVPAAWLQGIKYELPAVEEMFQDLRNHILQVVV